MQPAKKTVAVEVNVPADKGALTADKAEAYGAALLREAASCAGEAKGASVERVTFRGCGPANLSLAVWCALVDRLDASFPGVKTARMRLDLEPGMVNPKTAEYAMRFRVLVNMDLGTLPAGGRLDEGLLADVKAALANMAHAKVPTFGATVRLAAHADFAAALDGLAALGLGYVRVVSDGAADLPAETAREKGFACADGKGMFARSAKYAAWFSDLGQADLYGFGVGSVSRFGADVVATTDDLDLYLREAGRSAAIYLAR